VQQLELPTILMVCVGKTDTIGEQNPQIEGIAKLLCQFFKGVTLNGR
jgi:hypothetical protein